MYNGEVYSWSKHQGFPKFLELAGQTSQEFGLALAVAARAAVRPLESYGWPEDLQP